MSGPDAFKPERLEARGTLPEASDSQEKPADFVEEHKETERAFRDPTHIQAEIADVDKKIANEREELEKSWGRFAMRPPESTSAIDSLMERRHALVAELLAELNSDTVRANTDQPDAGNTERDRPSNNTAQKVEVTPGSPSANEAVWPDGDLKEAPVTLRDSFSRAAESVRSIGNIFGKRIDRNLYPLLARDDVTRINAAAAELEHMSPKSAADYQKVVDIFQTISRGLENYGNQREPRTLNEDGESLRGISTFAQQTQSQVRDLKRALSQHNAQGAEAAARAADRLANTIEKIGQRASRAASRLDEYRRR